MRRSPYYVPIRPLPAIDYAQAENYERQKIGRESINRDWRVRLGTTLGIGYRCEVDGLSVASTELSSIAPPKAPRHNSIAPAGNVRARTRRRASRARVTTTNGVNGGRPEQVDRFELHRRPESATNNPLKRSSPRRSAAAPASQNLHLSCARFFGAPRHGLGRHHQPNCHGIR
jgi:hypothetical protein